MSADSKSRQYLGVATLCFVLALAAVPAEAQREYEPLFDKFNFRIGVFSPRGAPRVVGGSDEDKNS
jgi:hypothetical protein